MTDQTPAPVPTAPPETNSTQPASTAFAQTAVAAASAVKPWYAQISNYVGAFIGIVGNALPYITPDFLESIGVSATAAHTISSIVAVILVAYKEKATTPGVSAK